ncbi:MAG: hypothetical protein LJE64_06850, partial [Desulfofustis sp.]|nr:hypothetical protein [Desulfofustis sp.]
VMERLRAIKADADEELMSGQEFGPFDREQGTVGLESIGYVCPILSIMELVFVRLFKKCVLLESKRCN